METDSLRARLRTVHVIPLTPFDECGQEFLPDVYEAHLGRLLDAGIRVLICGAGTGEFHALSAAEMGQLVTIAAGTSGAECVVWGAVGGGLRHALAGGHAALDAGASGVMVMPPGGPYLSDAGLADYYRALLDELGCPTAIYRRGALPSDGLLLELAADPRVVAIKFATDDVLGLAHLTARCDTVEWIDGNAERWAPYYFLSGATGFTSGTANLVPRLSLKLHAALAAGDYAAAMRLQRYFVPLEDYRAHGGTSYNIVALKHAMRHYGLSFGPARPPMRRLTAAEELEVDALARALLDAEERECG